MKKALFYIERNLHLPFLEPIHDILKTDGDFEVVFSSPPYVEPRNGQTGLGLEPGVVKRLQKKSRFVADPEQFGADVTVVADVSFSLRNCGKIVNVGHGLISKGGFYRDAPIVRRENLADLVCVPGPWHQEVLQKNVFVPIVVTGFIKSDRMFGPAAVTRDEACRMYGIDRTKRIVLFAPTFNPELSGIPVLGEQVGRLANDDTLLLIKLHGMTDASDVRMYKDLAKRQRNVILVDDIDITPSLVAADVVVSDVSSAVVEDLLLDKPVVVVDNPRTKEYPYYDAGDIEYRVRDACVVVQSAEQLVVAVNDCLENPSIRSGERRRWSDQLSFGRDGKSAWRAAEAIRSCVDGNLPPSVPKKETCVIVVRDGQSTPEDLRDVLGRIKNEWQGGRGQTSVLSHENSAVDPSIPGADHWITPKDIPSMVTGHTGSSFDRVVFIRADVRPPAKWLRTLGYYFTWYGETDAVCALTSHDDYKSLIRQYVPHVDPRDFSRVSHEFRHFIGSDIRSSSINTACIAVKSAHLKRIDAGNLTDEPSSVLEALKAVLIADKAQVRIAPDVFVMDNAIPGGSGFRTLESDRDLEDQRMRLAARIRENPWDLEARRALFRIQQTHRGALSYPAPPGSTDHRSKASIILVTYNQLQYTKECVASVLRNTSMDFEMVFVDNDSADGTLPWLTTVCRQHPNFKLIVNEQNAGFPAAVNQGIKQSTGDYVVLLNNDTHVTAGWLERLVEVAASDPAIGIVGPVSNAVSGIQKDEEAQYRTIREMHTYAARVRSAQRGRVQTFPRVAFLCTLIKREVIEKLGGLDERFSPGNFEDDDYCLRSQIEGYKTAVARDVFIHHYGSKSFTADGMKHYTDRLETNQKIFFEKWGATPEHIWFRGAAVRRRNTRVPLRADRMVELYERAVILVREGDFRFAATMLDQLLQYPVGTSPVQELPPPDVLYDLAGSVCLRLNDFQKARRLFEKELELNPNSAKACAGLGQVFLMTGFPVDARMMFEWTLRIDPADARAIAGLKRVKEFPGANDGLPEPPLSPSTAVPGAPPFHPIATQDDVPDYEWHFQLALEHLKANRLRQARDEAAQAEHLYGNDPATSDIGFEGRFFSLMGAVTLATDQLDEAKQWYERALAVAPDSPEACSGLGEVFFRSGLDEHAKTMFEWALKADETSEVACKGLAKVNRLLGKSETHNTLARQGVESRPAVSEDIAQDH